VLFFERVFETIKDFDKDKAIIIGDSLTSDILGGINAGIRTCWFNPKHKQNNMDFRADYEVDSLDKIPGLLESI
jgi:2-haloacid dehalogenase